MQSELNTISFGTPIRRIAVDQRVLTVKVRSKAQAATQSRPLAQDEQHKKIRALWLFLYQIGVVKNPAESALAAYVKRITGRDAMQWLAGDQLEQVIESLKKWAMRSLPDLVQKLAAEAQQLPLTAAQCDELNQRMATAMARKTFDPMLSAWEGLTAALKAKEEA
ncbi:regulatory protein GemA [Chromobacterium violaceum]|uniref:Mu-like prophage protein gp16 n=2 Tax=Chromobacterium violaceum TaxID=536 RepID=A0AAX2M8D4_CHRVL|nr:regulatory protein GemA [Chromobacterium violaceum]STB70625.1 Mu-like prophage protein gp16 [Chromobacterium violaceum]SUX32752.1 Mu-like prophage protein gp16 [Chromobacterium violaceum]